MRWRPTASFDPSGDHRNRSQPGRRESHELARAASRRAAGLECCRCRVRGRDRRTADPSGVNLMSADWRRRPRAAAGSHAPGVMSFSVRINPPSFAGMAVITARSLPSGDQSMLPRLTVGASRSRVHRWFASEDGRLSHETRPIAIRRAGRHGGDSKVGQLLRLRCRPR